jgi:hypothetical protein
MIVAHCLRLTHTQWCELRFSTAATRDFCEITSPLDLARDHLVEWSICKRPIDKPMVSYLDKRNWCLGIQRTLSGTLITTFTRRLFRSSTSVNDNRTAVHWHHCTMYGKFLKPARSFDITSTCARETRVTGIEYNFIGYCNYGSVLLAS